VATTYRKATTALPLGGEDQLGSSAVSRKNRSAKYFARQGAKSVDQAYRLEMVVPLFAVMAETAAALHAQWYGSTVSVTGGNLLGRSHFAVSTYPERSVELTGAPTRDQLFAFAVLNSELLLQPNHALGTWFDSQRQRHTLDVVVCCDSLDKAISLGRNQAQQAIFDLKEAREILLTFASGAADEFSREES